MLQLGKLNETGAYYIQSLIFGAYVQKPSWFWIVPLLSVFSLANLVLSIFYPVFVLLFIPALTSNLILHFWNKKNILTYSNSIPQLMNLNKVAFALLKSGVIFDNEGDIKKAQEHIQQESRSAIFYKLESLKTSDFGQLLEFILELIKVLFLLEPILIFRIIEKLDHRRDEILALFSAVAKVDVAISIESFREGLPYFTKPSVESELNSMQVDDLFHPLIVDPVENSLHLIDGKSVLISGSNMSGKTTFIRAVGINCMLAQTINTACAKRLAMPPTRIFSAIRISDDLMDDTSYYYEEVRTIKQMISACDSGEQNLFLLDEIFKGTNTIERIASGKAVLSFLGQGKNTVLVSTHDLELIDLLKDSYNFYHFSEKVDNDELSFDYKLKPGRLKNTNAIRILEINGFPKEITHEANALAEEIQAGKEVN